MSKIVQMLGWLSADAARASPPQPLQRLAVLGIFLRQELQSHEAAKLGVLGFVNDTHAAATELFDDAIVRYGFADHCSVNSVESLSVTLFRSCGHAAFQFFKPVQHDVDLRRGRLRLLGGLEHQEALAVR